MKKEDVPQDPSALVGVTRDVCYVKDKDGKYTTDLSIGWDGVFNGVPQNIETYVYQVSADTFLDSEPTITKTGTFKLLR